MSHNDELSASAVIVATVATVATVAHRFLLFDGGCEQETGVYRRGRISSCGCDDHFE